MAWLQIFIGFAALIWSADRLVGSGAQLAHQLGVKPLVIGLTIIGFGTSAPEIFVAISASLSGNAEIAIGNAVGSNIANIGFIIGFCAMLQPLPMPPDTIRKELYVLITISLLVSALITLFGFPLWLGAILLSVLAAFLYWLLKTSKQEAPPIALDEELEIVQQTKKQPYWKLSLWLLVSLIVLIVSSKALVTGAVTIAKQFGVSEAFIGLTLIAVGTSLPELVTSLVGIVKKHHGIAIGNIIGSNVFNLTAVLSPVAFLAPFNTPGNPLLFRDLPTMMLFTLLFSFPFLKSKPNRHAVGRAFGTGLFILYICYLTLLALQSKIVVE